MKHNFLILFLLINTFVCAQEFSLENLLTMGDEDLLSLFNKVSEDSVMAERVARVYLQRGRKEKDTIKMARGYDRLARIFHPRKNIMFADSVIELTKNINHKTYPALGYILKSYEYHRLGDLKLRTENELISYKLSLKNDNLSQQLYILDNLIASKGLWGDKKEALRLQIERHRIMTRSDYIEKIIESTRKDAFDYIDEIYKENELLSIQNFVFCYLSLRKMDSARSYLLNGIEKVENFKGYNYSKDYFSNWFQEASVEIDFYSGDLKGSIEKSNTLLNDSERSLPNSTILNLNFYKGLSLINIGEEEVGINYLKVADSIFETGHIIILPDQRVLFELLMEHFKLKGELEEEIKYLNKMIFTDSIFKRNFQFFEPDLIKNFERPKLLHEKEVLIEELKKKNNKAKSFVWFGVALLSLSCLIIGYYFKRQQLYKRRFENLITENSIKKNNDRKNCSKSLEIPTNIIDEIMLNLHHFEMNNEYLSQTISLYDLASSFKTNPRYLSKVINFQKEKHFPLYINDLRVDYALKELSKSTKFRKFTIKAIAADSGFKSSESFSKAFYRRHGIYPSYYIKKLEALKN